MSKEILPIPDLLNKSDILLLPSSAKNNKSKNYTSAMKLFEYMSVGKPIIASDIPSNTEVLENNIAEKVIDINNSINKSLNIYTELSEADFNELGILDQQLYNINSQLEFFNKSQHECDFQPLDYDDYVCFVPVAHSAHLDCYAPALPSPRLPHIHLDSGDGS